MKLSDLTPLGRGVFELEKGDGGQKIVCEDIAKLEFGGIQTAFTPKELTGNVDVL